MTVVKEIMKDIDKAWQPLIDKATTATEVCFFVSQRQTSKTFLCSAMVKILEEAKKDIVEARDITDEVYLEAVDVKDIDLLLTEARKGAE